MEVYVDNIMVKTKCTKNHVPNLNEVFEIIKSYKMWFNPKKFVFGVASGKFLGYLVLSRGIKANLDKISTLINMISLSCLKDVQQLNGHIAALGRLISKCIEKCLLFFSIIEEK